MSKKLVLSLGSGGVRGFVHLGVYKSLFENNIKVDAIYGCSIGSMVGAFIADGHKPEELIELGLSVKAVELFDLKMNWDGVIGGRSLNSFVARNVSKKNLQDLNIPLTVVATDTAIGKPVYFTKGNLPDIVQASCSIPNIFQPKVIDGIEYLDGDLCSPIPIKKAREDHGDSAIILAVNIIASAADFPREHRKWARWIEKDTYRNQIVSYESPFADLILTPNIGYGKYFDRAARLMRIEKGYQAMQEKIPYLKRILGTV